MQQRLELLPRGTVRWQGGITDLKVLLNGQPICIQATLPGDAATYQLERDLEEIIRQLARVPQLEKEIERLAEKCAGRKRRNEAV